MLFLFFYALINSVKVFTVFPALRVQRSEMGVRTVYGPIIGCLLGRLTVECFRMLDRKRPGIPKAFKCERRRVNLSLPAHRRA